MNYNELANKAAEKVGFISTSNNIYKTDPATEKLVVVSIEKAMKDVLSLDKLPEDEAEFIEKYKEFITNKRVKSSKSLTEQLANSPNGGRYEITSVRPGRYRKDAPKDKSGNPIPRNRIFNIQVRDPQTGKIITDLPPVADGIIPERGGTIMISDVKKKTYSLIEAGVDHDPKKQQFYVSVRAGKKLFGVELSLETEKVLNMARQMKKEELLDENAAGFNRFAQSAVTIQQEEAVDAGVPQTTED